MKYFDAMVAGGAVKLTDINGNYTFLLKDDLVALIALLQHCNNELDKFPTVEFCHHCEHENEFDAGDIIAPFKAKCKNCGETLLLCDSCFHSDDNVEQRCDWREKCFREVTT